MINGRVSPDRHRANPVEFTLWLTLIVHAMHASRLVITRIYHSVTFRLSLHPEKTLPTHSPFPCQSLQTTDKFTVSTVYLRMPRVPANLESIESSWRPFAKHTTSPTVPFCTVCEGFQAHPQNLCTACRLSGGPSCLY